MLPSQYHGGEILNSLNDEELRGLYLFFKTNINFRGYRLSADHLREYANRVAHIELGYEEQEEVNTCVVCGRLVKSPYGSELTNDMAFLCSDCQNGNNGNHEMD